FLSEAKRRGAPVAHPLARTLAGADDDGDFSVEPHTNLPVKCCSNIEREQSRGTARPRCGDMTPKRVRGGFHRIHPSAFAPRPSGGAPSALRRIAVALRGQIPTPPGFPYPFAASQQQRPGVSASHGCETHVTFSIPIARHPLAEN